MGQTLIIISANPPSHRLKIPKFKLTTLREISHMRCSATRSISSAIWHATCECLNSRNVVTMEDFLGAQAEQICLWSTGFPFLPVHGAPEKIRGKPKEFSFCIPLALSHLRAPQTRIPVPHTFQLHHLCGKGSLHFAMIGGCQAKTCSLLRTLRRAVLNPTK